MILDPEAVGDGTGSGVDVCLEGSDAADQVLSRGMAMMIGEVLAQPAPECLDRHQMGTVAGQRDRVDAQASGGRPDRLGPVIARLSQLTYVFGKITPLPLRLEC